MSARLRSSAPLVEPPLVGPPLVEPGPPLDDAARERYARQLRLPQIGDLGQRRLLAARVLVLGAGGIGAPVIAYLAAAGVGTIGIVDSDDVEISNLHRQLAHTTADVGRSKARSAAETVAAINPDVDVVAIDARIDESNADELLRGYDLVLDGLDTFGSRYVVSDAAERAGVPHVWGSALGLDGQVAVFWAAAHDDARDGPRDGARRGVTLRDLHPAEPDGVDSCSTVGVLGPLCGAIGSMMAAEAIKLIVGFGDPLIGRVLVHDALDASWSELPLERRAARPSASIPAPAPAAAVNVVSPLELHELLATDAPPTVLDIRERDEPRATVVPGTVWLPQSELSDEALRALGVDQGATLVVYCATGVRSRAVASALSAAGRPAATLRGGALLWR